MSREMEVAGPTGTWLSMNSLLIPESMKYRKFGKKRFKTSETGVGAWTIGGGWGVGLD
jgi:hypothetical protein